MATNTETLGLKKPSQEDFYNVDDFNENFQKIDDFATGLKNVDNTSDANKPVSTAQEVAIADAKKAGTDAQNNLNSHTSNRNNPHNVTKEQLGLSNIVFGSGSPVGGAIGGGVSVGSGGAVGGNAKAGSGGAVGGYAEADTGGAIGFSARTGRGFAGGYSAKTLDASDNLIDAIQLGYGTNPNAKTLQVYTYQLMNANGLVPSERLPIIEGTYTGTGTHGASNPCSLTFPFTPKVVFIFASTNVDAAFHASMPIIHGCATARIHFRVDASSDRCYSDGIYLTWGDKTLSWYATNATYKAPMQLNASGVVYKYVAIG